MSDILRHLFHPKFIHMTLFGFVAGIPYSLIFGSLSLWLGEVGVAKSSITLFSWAALGYSFKYLWSPLADQLPIPWLTQRMGQRRSWLLVAQILIMASILMMAMTNPANGDGALVQMALAATLLGFSAATQDISIDAWRIEAANEQDIAMLSSVYLASYRLGMITSSFGVLYLAGSLGTSTENYQYAAWQISYGLMAALILIGVFTTFWIKEPTRGTQDPAQYANRDYLAILSVFVLGVLAFALTYKGISEPLNTFKTTLSELTANQAFIGFLAGFVRFLCALTAAVLVAWLISQSNYLNKSMIQSVYWAPVKDLFMRNRKHVFLLVGIICTYRISDLVMGTTSNIFYQAKGFTLQEIAEISKFFGLGMTILGGLLGGVMVIKFGLLRIMIWGAVLSALTNLLFMVMAGMDKSMLYLTVMIVADNLAQGMALTAFIAFLSMLVNRQFTAVQYAMFSSVMTLFPKILGGYSGAMVENMGFAQFYLLTTIIGIPVVLMLVYAHKVNAFDFSAFDQAAQDAKNKDHESN